MFNLISQIPDEWYAAEMYVLLNIIVSYYIIYVVYNNNFNIIILTHKHTQLGIRVN